MNKTTTEIYPKDSKKLGKIKKQLRLSSKADVITKIILLLDKLKLWKKL